MCNAVQGSLGPPLRQCGTCRRGEILAGWVGGEKRIIIILLASTTVVIRRNEKKQ